MARSDAMPTAQGNWQAGAGLLAGEAMGSIPWEQPQMQAVSRAHVLSQVLPVGPGEWDLAPCSPKPLESASSSSPTGRGIRPHAVAHRAQHSTALGSGAWVPLQGCPSTSPFKGAFPRMVSVSSANLEHSLQLQGREPMYPFI